MHISQIVEAISKVPGVKAIALGGSQSRNEADQHSDFDIGLYYDKDNLDIAALELRLEELDDGGGANLLNPPGQWGPWINGGAWLTVDSVPVDILLREIGRVKSVINDCLEGIITIDYQCGHPFGFVKTIYAAETHYSRPLWQDQSMPLDRLKALLYSNGKFSPRMREAVIKKFQWEAWFSLACGRKAALKGDINYAVGSVFRAVSSWVEVLYALNSKYLMNEKGTLSNVARLNCKPIDMETRVRSVYKLFADGYPEQAYEILDKLHSEIDSLLNDMQPVNTKIR
jgi:hypothetical protein